MGMQNVKEEARRLVENSPEDVTWDDLMYQIYVRQNIEAVLADSEADRVVDVEEIRKRFGLSG
jgi:DNA-binding transcriptional regulator YiaG